MKPLMRFYIDNVVTDCLRSKSPSLAPLTFEHRWQSSTGVWHEVQVIPVGSRSTATEVFIHILFVLFDTRLAVGVDPQKPALDHCRNHQHLKQLSQNMCINSRK
jgi:hypothetical protein